MLSVQLAPLLEEATDALPQARVPQPKAADSVWRQFHVSGDNLTIRDSGPLFAQCMRAEKRAVAGNSVLAALLSLAAR